MCTAIDILSRFSLHLWSIGNLNAEELICVFPKLCLHISADREALTKHVYGHRYSFSILSTSLVDWKPKRRRIDMRLSEIMSTYFCRQGGSHQTCVRPSIFFLDSLYIFGRLET